MILTAGEIKRCVRFETPLDAFQVNPHSVDLRTDSDVVLRPGEHFVARTIDHMTLPNDVMAVVYPRSSLNRSLVTLDMTGIVDAGYSGQLVLPLTNHSEKPVRIRKGQRIASLLFHRLEEPVEPRLSKYHGTDGAFLPDKDEEVRLLMAGDIEELKKKFPA